MARGIFDNEATFTRRITMSYEEYDEKGNQVANVKRSLIDDHTELLDAIIAEFLYFLHGLTFNYVDSVVPMNADGDVIE